MLQSAIECNRVLQSIKEHYRVLHRITEYSGVFQSIREYYRVLQSFTEYYKVYRVLQNFTTTKTNLAHLLGPFFGPVVFVLISILQDVHLIMKPECSQTVQERSLRVCDRVGKKIKVYSPAKDS